MIDVLVYGTMKFTRHDDVITCNAFHITGHLCGESIDRAWLSLIQISQIPLMIYTTTLATALLVTNYSAVPL